MLYCSNTKDAVGFLSLRRKSGANLGIAEFPQGGFAARGCQILWGGAANGGYTSKNTNRKPNNEGFDWKRRSKEAERMVFFYKKNIGAKRTLLRRWSGRRDSNSLPPPWQGGALPNELRPHCIMQQKCLTELRKVLYQI